MAETVQWGRECSVQIGELLVEAKPREDSLRVAFVVDRELGSVPPRAQVAIWGLSESTRNSLEQQSELPCAISAGYDGASANIFTGLLGKGESRREGTDWVFAATVKDECQKADTIKQKARVTFKEGAELKTVLVGLVKTAGLKPGNCGMLGIPFVSELRYQSGTDKLEKSLSVYGDGLDELGYFCRSIGVVWSVDDGAFRGQIAGAIMAPGPMISKDTGLIEPQPRFNEKGHVIGTALLLPELRPGVGFTLQSRRASGQFIAAQTRHSGDTHGANDWKVEFRGVPPDGFGAVLAERWRYGAQP